MIPTRFIVLSRPYEGSVREAVQRALARETPEALPVFIANSGEGHAEVISLAEHADPDAVAVAVGEVQRAAAWDESPHMVIAVNGSSPRKVTLAWSGTDASVTVEHVSNREHP